ncbi:MAG: EthD family reductase [Betaproteobacteria bacterium]|nr:EthD family reductase [Betaproteobacteria bacterium]
MVKVLAMYGQPIDAAAFDDYYFKTHVPLAKTLPGLIAYEVSRGPVMGVLDGSRPHHLIATLSFDSAEAVQAALQSSVGQATAADLANFATGGVTLIMFANESI